MSNKSLLQLLILAAWLLGQSTAFARSTGDFDGLEPYVDGVMRAGMARNDIAGSAISIVRGGESLLSKGYGHGDVATQTPIDPETTMFRIGSITKTFTWLSIMQQVERGRLDLKADVGGYLKHFTIPDTFPEAITLSHLMTHTAGFEDKIIGLFARTADDLLPLSEVLARELPARVRAPGQFIAYSNHGAALGGYIVAMASGTSWEDYVEQEILDPLGMVHTTPRQPIPEALAQNMSRGYVFRKGAFIEQPFQFVPTAPAGVMSSSAADMARFMTMLLRYGAAPNGRILTEKSGRQMTSTLFSPDPHVAGNAHGFAEHRFNGMRFIGHGGSTMVFHSYFIINFEEDFGIFVTNNSSGATFNLSVIHAILDRLYPAPPLEVLAPGPQAAETAAQVEGVYSTLRHEYRGAAKISRIMPMSSVYVTAEADGAILVAMPDAGTPVRYVETDPLVYREENGPEVIAFRKGEDGLPSHLFLGNTPYYAYERQQYYETAAFSAQLVGTVLLLLTVSLIVWPIRAVVRIRRGETPEAYRGSAMLLRAFAWLVCGLHVAFVVSLASALSDPLEIVFGMPEAAQRAFAMTIPLALASGVLALLAVPAFRNRFWSFAGRLHYAAVALAMLALVAWEHYWNFLGHRY
ncbi:MAG: beta-lactamase family protein [bacterium]|nr:beta-lactamase family protein [bacterium]